MPQLTTTTTMTTMKMTTHAKKNPKMNEHDAHKEKGHEKEHES